VKERRMKVRNVSGISGVAHKVIKLYGFSDLVGQFRAKLDDRPEGSSDAVAAIETLLDLIRNSKGVMPCHTCMSHHVGPCYHLVM
jgi:hypothetical protein